MKDDLIDPLIKRGFKKITSRLIYKNIIVFLLILALYLVALRSFTSYSLAYFHSAFFLVAFYFFGGFDFFVYVLQANLRQSFPTQPLRLKKKYLLSWWLWMVAIVAVSRVGWLAENFDPGTVLFLAYLPAIGLFRIRREVNALFALSFLALVPFLLIGKFMITAERWAIIAYFLLITTTVQGVIELQRK